MKEKNGSSLTWAIVLAIIAGIIALFPSEVATLLQTLLGEEFALLFNFLRNPSGF